MLLAAPSFLVQGQHDAAADAADAADNTTREQFIVG